MSDFVAKSAQWANENGTFAINLVLENGMCLASTLFRHSYQNKSMQTRAGTTSNFKVRQCGNHSRGCQPKWEEADHCFFARNSSVNNDHWILMVMTLLRFQRKHLNGKALKNVSMTDMVICEFNGAKTSSTLSTVFIRKRDLLDQAVTLFHQ